MYIKNIRLLSLSLFLLSSTTTFADKPEWAGQGGKPTKYEKREHKENMTSKHEYKKQKKHKKDAREDREYSDRERDHENVTYRSRDDSHNSYSGAKYEGQGMSDSEYIEEKKDETKKNWIGKFFDFLN